MTEYFNTPTIYTDKCSDSVKKVIEEELGLRVIVRNIEEWNIDYITRILTDPYLTIVVIHQINEMSISEMTMASFMCKKILAADKSIHSYKTHLSMVDDIELTCNLTADNNSFIKWYKLYGGYQ